LNESWWLVSGSGCYGDCTASPYALSLRKLQQGAQRSSTQSYTMLPVIAPEPTGHFVLLSHLLSHSGCAGDLPLTRGSKTLTTKTHINEARH